VDNGMSAISSRNKVL